MERPKKMVDEPLFRSYVFAHIVEDEKPKVRETKGVLNFVYWLGQPAVIRDQEIEIIKHFWEIMKILKFRNLPLK